MVQKLIQLRSNHHYIIQNKTLLTFTNGFCLAIWIFNHTYNSHLKSFFFYCSFFQLWIFKLNHKVSQGNQVHNYLAMNIFNRQWTQFLVKGIFGPYCWINKTLRHLGFNFTYSFALFTIIFQLGIMFVGHTNFFPKIKKNKKNLVYGSAVVLIGLSLVPNKIIDLLCYSVATYIIQIYCNFCSTFPFINL